MPRNYQKQAEDMAVDLMLRTQLAMESIIREYEEKLEQLTSNLMATIAQHQDNLNYFNTWEGKSKVLKFQQDLYNLTSEYAETVDNTLNEIYLESLETFMSDSAFPSLTLNEREREAFIESMRTANENLIGYSIRDSFEKYVAQSSYQISNVIAAIIAGTISQETFITIQDLISSMSFYLRRIAKTSATKQANQGLYDLYSRVGIEKIRWETRPEATPSGTCKECEGHAKGGRNFDGIYLLGEVPESPAHPHCACVLVPIIS